MNWRWLPLQMFGDDVYIEWIAKKTGDVLEKDCSEKRGLNCALGTDLTRNISFTVKKLL